MEGHARGHRLLFAEVKTGEIGRFLRGDSEGRTRSDTLLPLLRLLGRGRPERLLGVLRHLCRHEACKQPDSDVHE
jgi:hypothetical protein